MKISRLALMGLLTSTSLLLPSLAAAQTAAPESSPSAPTSQDARDTSELGDIVVTATKRSESVNKVGITINALGASELKNLTLNDPKDIQLTVPGLVVSNSQGSNLPNFVIRGVGLNDFAPNNSSPVAVHLDEVYFSYSAFLNFGLFDLERVEVLKGPQGTTFGRNTTGGAVNFYSAKPSFDPSGSVTVGLGNFGAYEGEFHLTGPISDKIAGRLSGFYKTQTGGPFYNRYYRQGGIGGTDGYWGLRGQLLFRPTDTLDILLNVHGGIQNSEGAQYNMLPALKRDGSGPCPAYLNGTLQGGESDCFDFNGNQEPDSNPYTNSAGLINRQRLANFGGNIRIDATLPFADLTSITAYEHLDRYAQEDADGFPQIIVDDLYRNSIKQFSQEVRLTSSTGGPLKWLLGGYYSNDKINTPQQEFVGADFIAPGGLNATYVQTTRSLAAFANAEYALTDSVTLIGGIRYTDERRSFDGRTVVLNDGHVIGAPGVPFNPEIVLASNNQSVAFHNVSWKAGVNFNAARDVLIYANVSRGFKSGGFNGNLAFSNPVLAPFGPENLTAYEGGIKAKLANNTLQLNLAGYYYDYKSIILQIGETLPGPGGVPFTVFRLNNGAAAEVYGVEADVRWLPIRGLELNGGFSYNYSRIKNAAAGNEALNGSELNYSPKFSGNFSARYSYTLAPGVNGHIQFSGTYKGDHYGEVPNTLVSRIKGYTLFGANVGISDPNDRWDLSFWVKNLTNKEYVGYLNDLVALGYVLKTPGDRRTFGAKLTYNF